MKTSRWIVAIIGILLPFVVRIPGGADWLLQYVGYGVGSIVTIVFVSVLNAIGWVPIILVSYLYHRPISILFPALPTFVALGFGHATLDLSADAQAQMVLMLLPMYSTVLVGVGGVLGLVYDQRTMSSYLRWPTRGAPLPRALSARVSLARVEKYCLNPDHPRGRYKAERFAALLGLTLADSKFLRKELLIAAHIADAVLIASAHPRRWYAVDFPLGIDDVVVVVRSIWLVSHENARPTFMTCCILRRC